MKRRVSMIICLVIFVLLAQGCGKKAENKEEKKEKKEEKVEKVEKVIINPNGNTLETRIETPENYTREQVEANSLGAFLRNYEMKEDGSQIKSFKGTYGKKQDIYAAIFTLPLESYDLQHSGESIIRVYAEYLKSVFNYSNTISLAQESVAIENNDINIGDIFIYPDREGYAVMVVDTCVNSEGKKAFLWAQGGSPAQEFHVLTNLNHSEDPWYYLDELTYPFKTPEYTFEQGSLKRPQY